MFKYEFNIFKKVLFLVIFCMTVPAYSYWAYLLYKIYTDNRPLFDKDGKFLNIYPILMEQYGVIIFTMIHIY